VFRNKTLPSFKSFARWLQMLLLLAQKDRLTVSAACGGRRDVALQYRFF
jgi:hypothetical protein